jgi:hypothetical protein
MSNALRTRSAARCCRREASGNKMEISGAVYRIRWIDGLGKADVHL